MEAEAEYTLVPSPSANGFSKSIKLFTDPLH
jgi:hypothetical protein